MKKIYMKICEKCGKEFTTTVKQQKYCCEECAKKGMLERQAQRRSVYRQLEEEEKRREQAEKIPQMPSPETALGRFLRMSLREVSAECARLHLTYGQVQVMAAEDKLPEDFGLRRR